MAHRGLFSRPYLFIEQASGTQFCDLPLDLGMGLAAVAVWLPAGGLHSAPSSVTGIQCLRMPMPTRGAVCPLAQSHWRAPRREPNDSAGVTAAMSPRHTSRTRTDTTHAHTPHRSGDTLELQ